MDNTNFFLNVSLSVRLLLHGWHFALGSLRVSGHIKLIYLTCHQNHNTVTTDCYWSAGWSEASTDHIPSLTWAEGMSLGLEAVLVETHGGKSRNPHLVSMPTLSCVIKNNARHYFLYLLYYIAVTWSSFT